MTQAQQMTDAVNKLIQLFTSVQDDQRQMRERMTRTEKPNNIRRRTTKQFTKPSLTEQCHKDACDVHKIVAKHTAQGTAIPQPSQQQYLDMAQITDFHDAMNTVTNGTKAFQALPAKVREHYENDPARFMTAVQNPDKITELTELGVFQAPPPTPETKATPSQPAQASTEDVSEQVATATKTDG